MSTKRQRIGYWKMTHGYVKSKPTSRAELYLDLIVFLLWMAGIIALGAYIAKNF